MGIMGNEGSSYQTSASSIVLNQSAKQTVSWLAPQLREPATWLYKGMVASHYTKTPKKKVKLARPYIHNFAVACTKYCAAQDPLRVNFVKHASLLEKKADHYSDRAFYDASQIMQFISKNFNSWVVAHSNYRKKAFEFNQKRKMKMQSQQLQKEQLALQKERIQLERQKIQLEQQKVYRQQ